jgi:hypothetical protein
MATTKKKGIAETPKRNIYVKSQQIIGILVNETLAGPECYAKAVRSKFPDCLKGL